MNRFSSDMTTVDETISQSISQLTNTLFSVFGALVGIAVATSGTFLIIMVGFTSALLLLCFDLMFRHGVSNVGPDSTGLALQQDPDRLPQDEHCHCSLGGHLALSDICVLLRDPERGNENHLVEYVCMYVCTRTLTVYVCMWCR